MREGIVIGLFACGMIAAGCGVQIEGGQQPPPDGQPTTDGPVVVADAPPDAAPLGPWGAPALVPGAGTTLGEDDGSLSSNANEMVFSIQDPNANNTKDLWYMSRTSSGAPWSAPVRLPFNVTGVSDETPRFSPDDLTLYFASARAGGLGGLDIYRVTRTQAGPGGVWGTPQAVPGVSTTGTDKWFMPCSRNNTYLTILGNNIGEGTTGSPPAVSAQLSSTGTETGTFLTPDCLTVYFASTRSGTNQIYVATRGSLGATWSAPTLVTDFQALGGAQEDPWVSPDQRTFALVSNVRGSKDIYLSTR
jgi:Tol biopolymer transport system component